LCIIDNQHPDTIKPLWRYFMTHRLLDILNPVLMAQRATISHKNLAVAQAGYAQAAI
jgi:hypothetical protein